MADAIVYEYGLKADSLLSGLEQIGQNAAAAEKMLARLATQAQALEKAGLTPLLKITQKVVSAQEAAAKSAEQQAAREESARNRAAAAAEKAAQKKVAADKASQAAIEEMAAKAVKAADMLGLQGRAQETVAKISVQYAEIIRETGDAQSSLVKAWQSGLSPAENSARKMVQLVAGLEDGKEATDAFKTATGEMGARLEDQIRRQDTNVGSQNKLSRSLSELIDELKAAQSVTLAVSAAQGQQAESAADVAAVMAKLEFETSDADKAGVHYQATMSALRERMTGLKESQEKVTEGYGRQKKGLDALENAMDSLGIPGAGLITKFKMMSDALETTSEMSTKATSALKAGLIGGAVVAGVAAVAAGFVALTANAVEWNDAATKVGLGVDKLTREKLKQNASALDTVGVSAKALGVTFASSVGPMVADAADGLSIFSLALRDGYAKTLPEYGAQVKDVTRRLKDQEQAEKAVAQAVQQKQQYLDMVAGSAAAEDAFRRKSIELARSERTSRLDGVAAVEAERDSKLASLREEHDALLKFGAEGAATTEAYERAKAEIVKSAEHQIRQLRTDTATEAKSKAAEVAQAVAESQKQQIETLAATAAYEQKRAVESLALEERGQQALAEIYAVTATAKQRIDMEDQARVAAIGQLYVDGAITYEQLEAAKTEIATQEGEKRKALAAEEASKVAEEQQRARDSYVADVATMGDAFGKFQQIATAAASKATSKRKRLEDQLAKSTDATEQKVLRSKIDSLKKQEAANHKAAVTAFRLQQATGVVGVAISTAQAIMQALGSLPPPASFIAAGVAATAGIASAALILSQSPPAADGGGGSSIPSVPSNAASTGGGGGSSSGARQSARSMYAAPVEASTAAPPTVSPVTSGQTTATNQQRAQDAQAIPVSDAFFPATMGARTFRTTPGDTVKVEQNPTGDSEMVGHLRELNRSFALLSEQLLYRRHFDERDNPAGRG